MLLHFIFMTARDELESRSDEFVYVQKMVKFFKSWIHDYFGRDFDVQCDQMAIDRTGIVDKPGIDALLHDHCKRGESTWHFYLANFRPFWTDSLSEGYHSENMCMTMWIKPPDGSDVRFLAEKNCISVSYELAHELLRQTGNKKAIDQVNEVWARHFSGAQAFAAYDANYELTSNAPEFLTIDPSTFSKIS